MLPGRRSAYRGRGATRVTQRGVAWLGALTVDAVSQMRGGGWRWGGCMEGLDVSSHTHPLPCSPHCTGASLNTRTAGSAAYFSSHSTVGDRWAR